MRAHMVRSRGQVAVHDRTPAVAARMPPAVLLVINLRIVSRAPLEYDEYNMNICRPWPHEYEYADPSSLMSMNTHRHRFPHEP